MSNSDLIRTVADLANDGSIKGEFVAAWLSAFQRTPGAENISDFQLTEVQRIVANDPEARNPVGRNLVIAGPTSAGKTMAVEMLMARLLTSAIPPYGCVYAVPLRALATEKWERFKEIFGEEDVYVSSGDYQDQDPLILNRRFRIAVVVYEKLYGWWLQTNARNAILRNMGLLIVDELQMLGDIQRGPRLELLLTFLRRMQTRRPVKFRIVGLGPNRDALSAIAAWQGAKLLAGENEDRPVPLAEGFICPGRPAQLVGNDERIKGMNVFVPDVRSASRDGMVKDLITGLLRQFGVGHGKRILVYSPTKDGAERLAGLLADVLGKRQDIDQPTEDALDALERTHAAARLRTTTLAGVGFHHGDLVFAERNLVERLFRAEPPATCLDVVVCTPTLAMGINLPADYMLLTSSESFKPKDWDERGNLPTPLSPLEYRNFAGRAGRYRPNAPKDHHGVALFISERTDEETRREIVEPIILGKVMPIASEMQRWPFGLEPLALAAAESLGADAIPAPTCDDVQTLFLATHAGKAEVRMADGTLLVDSVCPALQKLAERHEELITSTYAVNKTGNVVARAGIHIQTYEVLKRIAERVKDGILDTPLVVLEDLGAVPEIVKLYPTSLSDRPQDQAKITRALRAFFQGLADGGQTLGPRAQKLIGQTHVPDRSTLETLMRVAAVWLWIEGSTAEQLSAQPMLPGIRYGACNLLGDQLHWLVSTLPDLWDALGLRDDTIDDDIAGDIRWAMGRLERRLRFGVPNALVGIAQLRVPGLHRENMMDLWQKVAEVRSSDRGWDHPVELLAIPPRSVGHLKSLLRALQRAVLARGWSDDPRPQWQKQIDIARLASQGDGQRFVDPRWPDLLRALWTEDDLPKLVAALAQSFTLKPILLNAKEQQIADGRSKYFILDAGRTILLEAVGDGTDVSWADVQSLWGTPGPTGAPVDGVLVLANGPADHLRKDLQQYGTAIRILTREALGHFIVQSLMAPETASAAPMGPTSVVKAVREWLCADWGGVLGTTADAEKALTTIGLDDWVREGRWLQGRARSRSRSAPVEDAADRTRRAQRLQLLRSDIERLGVAHAGLVDEAFLESLVTDFLADVELLEHEPRDAVAHARTMIEELAALCLHDHGINAPDTLEGMLAAVRAQAIMPENWVQWATSLVRTLSNPAHHADDRPGVDGRFVRHYSFAEAYELLSPTVRLWDEYLARRPTTALARPSTRRPAVSAG